ncbi:MAG TPA: TonB-dependent receptor [Candidatus Acidoferrales bacterium]|nr:TonB-dependent receptor [Candidatus Acidoferrales bacterium]
MKRAMLLAGLIPLLSISLFGQAFYGSIVGTVTDPSNAAVHGATVTLTNIGTDERHQSPTGADGGYQFVNLLPGFYKVEVELTGFKRAAREHVEVTVAGAVRADISMQVGDVTQTVEVQATAPLLQTENANLSHVVNSRSVEELPVNGRNILNLAALVPGVVPQGTTDGNALTGKNVFAAGNYQIGGGIANQSATYYDGVPANAGVGNLTVMVPSPDAISEFRVQTNSNSAEFGRYAGGVINVTSKSGTNEFHGSAYEFFRNKVLNANTFFANANGTGKPAFTQNQYGVTGGGPVRKNKIFFFGAWEGYDSRQGATFLATVPLPAMNTGDFSGYKNAAGAVIPIYDPLTQCGQYSNAACGTGTIQRTPFPGNIIPANRINPVAAKIVAFPMFSPPNQPGQAFTQNINYSKNAASGGNNNQYNGRFDYTATDKLRIFGRYSRWASSNTPFIPFNNGIYGGDPYSPETYVTTEYVLGATYLISPKTVLDVRASYGRWNYLRTQPFTGINMSQTFGFPAYMDQQLPIIHGGPGTSVPSFSIGNYTALSGQPGFNNSLIFSIDDDYVLTPTLTKVMGRHTLKFGADIRDLQNNYYQAPGGGTFSFDNLITSQNALSPGASGNGLASLLLGYGSSGNALSFALPWQSLNYQGYFAQDTWQATNKLTITAGVRWEIPGVYKERYNRAASFNPNELNPALNGITVNGQPVYGAADFINTSQHPETGLKTEHFNLLAPRLGLAYRLNDKTVIRAGAGIYYLPANLQFNEGPYGNALNQFTNPWLSTLNGEVTPLYPISDPFPTGFIPSLGNLSHDKAQALLVGAAPAIQLATTPYPYNEQWNVTLQRQVWGGVAIEAAYAGSHGVHLPRGSWQADALPTQYLSMGSALNNLVPNPFFGLVQTGALSQPTVKQGQLLLPFPEYTGVSESGGYLGNSTYHSLQMKVEKRFAQGGTVLAAYTFSKLIGDVGSLTTWLDSGVGLASNTPQNPNNLRAEKSLAGFDSRQRLTVAYTIDIPVGKGQRFLTNGNAVTQKVVSGWSLSGGTTFQDGFPLALTATPNVTGFNLGLRPNVVPGCNRVVGGSAQSRLNGWFNVSCFTVPSAYTLGNESLTDPVLRGPGINNFNVALFKKIPITERFKLEFRAEVFNLFNRVQFGFPNTTVTTAANPTTGYITTQINQPRLIQLALRLVY